MSGSGVRSISSGLAYLPTYGRHKSQHNNKQSVAASISDTKIRDRLKV
jgi:hypothetical protein